MKYKIKVIPNAKIDKVIEREGTLIVKVKEKPEKGKATVKVLKLLSEYFNKPVHLISGALTREKIIETE
jgi:uncharacterized protein (TIGR00251 family)